MEIFLAFVLGLVTATLIVVALRRLLSFAAQSPEDYAEAGTEFDIRQQLDGPMICEGVIYGPTGRVAARFIADFNASWDGDTGVMTEDFRYDTGTTLHREWTLQVDDAGRIRATAPDLVGAGEGRQAGSGVQLSYDIRLPESSGGHVLRANDWMYLLPNGTIVNRSELRKFGIKVSEIVATMRPAGAEMAGRPALAAE